ncbi:carboxymuconolactone decarboxylase family protein [Streptomyces polygonati]|uniref:Carboxymuconolactone decarboxylase family protein n=1 Tax=Streptomyces polygonati TaxID=1617087 RepID=A0ABV8HZ50_9ACTN
MTDDVSKRLNYGRQTPDVFRAMMAFSQASAKGLDPVLVELVKIRASQINRCAYCLDLHLAMARKAGESEQRIDLLTAWEEVPGVYTEKERAALALTESVTLLTDGFVPDAVYERAAQHFDDDELAALVSVIVAINAWNRLNVAFRTPPGGEK